MAMFELSIHKVSTKGHTYYEVLEGESPSGKRLEFRGETLDRIAASIVHYGVSKDKDYIIRNKKPGDRDIFVRNLGSSSLYEFLSEEEMRELNKKISEIFVQRFNEIQRSLSNAG